MGPWAHAGALVRIVFQARGVGRALRFGRQPPLRFGVLLLLAGAFLFTLLKGHVRFFCHRHPRCNVLSRDAGRMPVRAAGAGSPASAGRRVSCAPRTSSSPSSSVVLKRPGPAVRLSIRRFGPRSPFAARFAGARRHRGATSGPHARPSPALVAAEEGERGTRGRLLLPRASLTASG